MASPPCTISFLLILLHAAGVARSQSYIGVNYGTVADNLPSPSATVKLLQSTSIGKVRLYGVDPPIIKALGNTGIGITIGAANGDIPAMATDVSFAKGWVGSNVLPYYPASEIILITVGNEVLQYGEPELKAQLLPAMQNVQNALDEASLGGKIKVSTVHSMTVLGQSEPPSTGRFDPGVGDLLKGLLEFNKATGSPFMINPYPFFAYQSDPSPETLAFCLFQPNAGRLDSGTNIKYMNMFDAQVDAVRSALNAMSFNDVGIVVAETGWPYKGEAGATVENAKAYNGNLVAHLRSMVGTPLMPGKSIDTYLFALYDEDLKPGKPSERAFGIYNVDLTPIYDIGLSKNSQMATLISDSAPWKDLKAHNGEIDKTHLRDLMNDTDRCKSMMIEFDGIFLDYSRQRATVDTVFKLFTLAEINSTENRSVLHVALRASKDTTINSDGKNVVPDVWQVLDKIRDFSDKVRNGSWVGATGKALKNVIAIGIGGSFLGPLFVHTALQTDSEASKSAGGCQLRLPQAVSKHMVAVSTNLKLVEKFRIDPNNAFAFWDWVGRRYSVCSAVGVLPLSLQYGFSVIENISTLLRLRKNIPTPEQLQSENVASHLVPHKTFTGNRPSLSLLLPSLDAYRIGQLLAIYEHRIGFIWGINSFDQWGVELGKSLASQVRKQLHASRKKGESVEGFNFSTTKLLTRYLEASADVPSEPTTLLPKI
ncbi:hypothetical protein L1987_47235 [Smallanthus sonchifolius]|uniref:Uncharacterized protein n=1 Tax=Smallanthus sonchifolius TaxID=185202 RepID=A0ACB9G220_9ASTR|nr:hypothetical protein L1987_47235 [Smallanthus sonchifolius]